MEHSYRRFALINAIGLGLSALLFTWIARSGTLDFLIEQRFFDPVTHTFPFKNAHYLVSFGHTLLKDLTTLGLVVAIVLALASNWVARLRPWRRALTMFCVMAGAAALLVQQLKGSSVHACPWDLAMYGGHDAWFPLFDRVSAAVEMGRCWPGGHASGGFAIIAGYFALRTQQPHWARRFLALGLTLGAIMGTVQMVRGAHFLSHNLWTLWFVWATCFLIDASMHVGTHLWQRRSTFAAVVLPDELADELPDATV
ncbi:MAG TPA: phosphatase PAP2 family protein [Oxalicibacterium sp.]|nr:phosphatase PAP2 family protein [Oxalicibacterium sp.]